jgi:phage protein U
MHAQLGDIKFLGLYGFQSMAQKLSKSYAQHQLVVGKPRIEPTGDNLDDYSFTLQLHKNFCNPEYEIARLADAVRSGTIMPFINGTGELFGDFVISEMQIERQQTDPVGYITLANIAVTLLEHVDPDKIETTKANAKKSGFANAANGPLTESYLPKDVGGAAQFDTSYAGMKLEYAQADQAITAAAANPASAATNIEKARKAIAKGQEKSAEVNEKLQAIQDDISTFENVQQQLDNIATYAVSVASELADGDVAGAVAANKFLNQGIRDADTAAVQIAMLNATRSL